MINPTWIKTKLKNKFVLTSLIFFVYVLFLDDVDIFMIYSQNKKLSQLNASKVEVNEKLQTVRTTLKQLKYPSELESFAREEKLFKKDDEDIFVITYE